MSLRRVVGFPFRVVMAFAFVAGLALPVLIASFLMESDGEWRNTRAALINMTHTIMWR